MDTNAEELVDYSWLKIKRNAEKAGFREGASDGRDQNFQKSFDEGFIEGFKNGFAVGFYKGALTKNQDKEEPLLEQIHRGWCQICPSTQIDDLNIPEQKIKQLEASNKYLNSLHSKFQNNCQIDLPKSIM